MNIVNTENDTLREEYDLTQLQIRKLGPNRKGIDVHLEPNEAETRLSSLQPGQTWFCR